MTDKDGLHSQLVRLGDMMGDGQHLERGGGWITKDYKRVCKALGYTMPSKPRVNRSEAINKAVAANLAVNPCSKCGGVLKQTRSGALRAVCTGCGSKFQLRPSKASA